MKSTLHSNFILSMDESKISHNPPTSIESEIKILSYITSFETMIDNISSITLGKIISESSWYFKKNFDIL